MPKKPRAPQPPPDRLRAVVRNYEHALVNIAKLAGQHKSSDGRLIHDPAHLAEMVLKDSGSDLWKEVDDLPYMVVEVDDEGVNVTVNKRQLAAYRKKGK